MIYLLSSIFALITDRSKNSVTKYMLALFLASSIGAFLVGRQHSWEIDTVILVIYTTILLLVIFFSYRKFGNICKVDLSDLNELRLGKIENYVTLLCLFTIVVEIYVLYKVMGILLIGMTNVEDFKGGDGTEQTAIYDSIISHFYLTICHFFSPIGYISLSLHFYYLIKKKNKKALKFLLLSLTLVFHGLIGLSRSATAIFILTYTCFFYFIIPLLDNKTKKLYLKVSIVSLIAIGSLLMVISNNRFGEYYTKNSKNSAIIDEQSQPILFSIVDYFVMWNENSIEFMKKRPLDLRYYGWYNTAGLPIMIDLKVLGNTKVYEQRDKEVNGVIESYVGELWYQFQGCVARLTYEWGYIGSVIFVIIFFYVVRMFSPKKGVLRFNHLLALPLLAPMGLTFWQGIGIGDLAVQMGMVYALIFYHIIKRNKIAVVKEVASLVNNSSERTKS